MDKHCRICHNTSCSNHGKNISFLGEGWKCNYIPVPTNADRIRKMNDEELKKFICSMFKCEFCDFELGERCGLLNWLQMPAEVDE